MKVLKFGGTSVGTVESLLNVKRIIERLSEPAVVVVSALGGLTDRLIATAGMASRGDSEWEAAYSAMVDRHHGIIAGVVPADRTADVAARVDELLAEIGRIYRGVALLGELPARTLDRIVSFGEQMSSVIVSSILPCCRHVDSLRVVRTEKWFSKDIADTALTERNILESVQPREGEVIVMGGFISTDRDTGEITNLGRGGSDYTAALVAAALNADVLEIWTDVDGFMTADPRIIPTARVIDHMSFIESMELCNYGAKVIYPPTIYPVFHKSIPIKILNTHHLEAPGTLIDDNPGTADSGSVCGVSVLRGTALVSIRGSHTVNVAEVSSRSYNALAKSGLSVSLLAGADTGDTLSFAVREAEVAQVLAVLNREFEPELQHSTLDSIYSTGELSTVAVVGENITDCRGLDERLYNSLLREGISVEAASGSRSATSITYVVKASQADKALTLLHDQLF